MKKIQQQQTAPDFTATTLEGGAFSLSALRGKKILLNFHRNVGCPVCNLRFHALQQQADYFREHNLAVIDVYESTAEHMRSYLEGMTAPSIMIPDPQLHVYRTYGVERSAFKVLKGLLKGGWAKARRGKALFRKPIKQDGNMDRIGAEFLIDENGKVQHAHYGAFLGDHIPLDHIRKFIEKT